MSPETKKRNSIAVTGILRKENDGYYIQTDVRLWLDLSKIQNTPEPGTLVNVTGNIEAYSFDVIVRVIFIDEVHG